MKKLIILLLLLITFISCKTQEEIEREKKIDLMSVQVKQGQSLSADFSSRLQEIEEELAQLKGQIESLTHQENMVTKGHNEQLMTVEEQQALLIESSRNTDARLETYESRLDAQNALISEMLKQLKASGAGKSPYQQAIHYYSKGKYAKAKVIYLSLYKDKKIKGSKRRRVLHNLGMISYIDKKYKDATIYFSKLYVEFPKSTYNASGLYFLGHSFLALKQNKDAKDSLKLGIKDFPKSRYRKKSQALLKTIK